MTWPLPPELDTVRGHLSSGVWKKDYAALIIPKSREDICGDCFIFMNAYKYKKAMPQKNKDGLTSDEEDEDDVVNDVDKR
jgi:hypothetical protein